MRIAVIPARGGSKRIPRKNIKSFAGKPMIAHAIGAAQRCGLFDRIVVSTDDAEIARVAKEYEAEVPFMRPAALADDFTPTVPVIAHAINACRILRWQVNQVCCIYPAVPFLQEADLASALHLLETNDAGYVFPIAAYPSAIQRALRQLPDGKIEPFYSQYATIRTQDLEPAYYDAGQFYWGRAQTWLEGKVLHQHAVGMIIPDWRVVDIDTHEDWQRAELMYAAFNGGKLNVR
jgi:pseudaminic acid cytidylyltransferase